MSGGHELGTTGSGVSGGGAGPVAEVGVHGSGCGGLIRGRILGDLRGIHKDGGGGRCVRENIGGDTDSGAYRCEDPTVPSAWRHGPRGVGDISEVDSLRCIGGGVNKEGHGVRCARTVRVQIRLERPPKSTRRGVCVGQGALTSPYPCDAAVTPCFALPRPRTNDKTVPRPGSARGARVPGRLRHPAPSAPPHRLGRVAFTTTAAAAATAASGHLGSASRTTPPKRARREGFTPRSDWLHDGQSASKKTTIGCHETDGQLPRPVTDG